ncbi:MAG: hypothetical protein V4622_13485 [Bacteroidota bacterium]
MKKIILFGALVFTFVALESCKKDEPKEEQTNDSTAPQSNAIIEGSFDDMTNMSDQAITGNLVYYKSPKVTFFYPAKGEEYPLEKVDCNVIVTLDTTGTTKKITIDWGATNCMCNDQKQRRGKIETTFTGKYRDSGTVITHTPIDYYVNDNQIAGTKTVTNKGLNSNGQPYFIVSVNGVATMSNGDVFTYVSNRVRTWTTGFTTITGLFQFSDDEYDITGSATASSSLGNGYVANIITALHVKVGCAYVTSGILEFTPTGKILRTINYGDGTCDNTFTVTINGVTYTING